MELSRVNLEDLSRLQLLSPNELFPKGDESEVAELRSHVLTSRYLFEIALAD